MNTLHLLYLDRYHQGDPLFLKELAQAFARSRPGEPPSLLLHGGGEKLERTLEAEGLFPEREAGIIVAETPRQEALAERAVREANQELVALFTEEEVSAVGLQGADRGLLRVDEEGRVEAGSLGWVADLVKMRVLPVVSALATGPATRAQAVPPARALCAVAEAIGPALGEAYDVVPCFLAKGSLPASASPAEPGLGVGALPEGVLAEPAVAAQVVRRHGHALLTTVRGLFAGEDAQQRRRLVPS